MGNVFLFLSLPVPLPPSLTAKVPPGYKHQLSVFACALSTYCHSSIHVCNTHFEILLIEVEPPVRRTPKSETC